MRDCTSDIIVILGLLYVYTYVTSHPTFYVHINIYMNCIIVVYFTAYNNTTYVRSYYSTEVNLLIFKICPDTQSEKK